MNKLGFHYFPDTKHYRQGDLHTWLPLLKEWDVSWLTLLASDTHAIPEPFLRGLVEAEIEPVVHMPLSLGNVPKKHELKIYFDCYARWGVNYLILFDRPNLRDLWGTTSWVEKGLVERFLDLFIPLAEEALNSGLIPVFPPLEQGGDYWDTSFLRAALEGLQRRAPAGLLGELVLSADARANSSDLSWGVGGPERWPEARPYYTPLDGQDQKGFRIGDWYSAISRAVFGKPLPIILTHLGGEPRPAEDAIERDQTITRLLKGQEVQGQEPLPDEILGGMFWLLSADEDSEHLPSAWVSPDGIRREVFQKKDMNQARAKNPGDHMVIDHYLLLPTYDGSVTDWHLEVIRGFVKKHRPTIGFSLEEAARASRVTVLAGEEYCPEEILNEMRGRGSVVMRITGDGTEIAAQLSRL